jgi:hypothetical protein
MGTMVSIMMDFPYSTIQNLEVVKWERAEIFLRWHVGVLVEEKPTMEDHENENMDWFGEYIHMAYRNLKYLCKCYGHK